MNEVLQISQPAVEPVTLAQALLQCGLGTPADETLGGQLTTQLTGLLLAARRKCESHTRSCFITTTWQYQCDSWPERDGRYSHHHDHQGIRLPKPLLQSIEFFQYVDSTGTLQQLLQDSSYGTDLSAPPYGYQLDRGTDVRPARLLPAWGRSWPPLRSVPNAVIIQFKSGFGGPVTASIAESSAVLTGPFFNAGDVGQAVSVPAAGPSGGSLVTTIASVDDEGVATLAASAQAAVVSAVNNVWVGQQVPMEIQIAILLMTQFLFEQGASTDLPMPRIVTDMLEEYRNRVA